MACERATWSKESEGTTRPSLKTAFFPSWLNSIPPLLPVFLFPVSHVFPYPPESSQRAVKPILMGKDCIAQAQSGEKRDTHAHTHTAPRLFFCSLKISNHLNHASCQQPGRRTTICQSCEHEHTAAVAAEIGGGGQTYCGPPQPLSRCVLKKCVCRGTQKNQCHKLLLLLLLLSSLARCLQHSTPLPIVSMKVPVAHGPVYVSMPWFHGLEVQIMFLRT